MSDINKILDKIQTGDITPEDAVKMIEELKNGDSTKNSKKSTMEILKSIESGEISTHDGISMMNKKDDDVDVHVETSSTFKQTPEELQALEKMWRIPWIIGLGIFIGTASGMNSIAMNYGFNFWFFLLILPLIIGVFILAVTWPSEDRPWVNVFVKEAGNKRNIVKVSVPLPVKFTSWAFNFVMLFLPLNIKDKIDADAIDQILLELKNGTSSGNPLHVHVDENGSEIVDIYIG